MAFKDHKKGITRIFLVMVIMCILLHHLSEPAEQNLCEYRGCQSGTAG